MDPPHVDDVLSSCTSDPEIQNFIYYENEWSATDADYEQFPVDFSKAARTDEDSAGHGVVAKGRNSRGSAPKRGGAIVAKRQSKVVSDDVGGGQQNNRLFQELALAFANQLEAQRMLACWRDNLLRLMCLTRAAALVTIMFIAANAPAAKPAAKAVHQRASGRARVVRKGGEGDGKVAPERRAREDKVIGR